MSLMLLNIVENDVVYEEYEDEIIFLHLRDGLYYTLDRQAADIFVAFLRASTAENALSWLRERYVANEEELCEKCVELVGHLFKENLVIERKVGALDEGKLVSFAGEKQPLSSYRIEKFEDIQDILKFDPVHEVTEDGWPSVIEE